MTESSKAAKITDQRAEPYVRVEGTTWPNPNDPREVEWRLRYGTPTREDLLLAASFIHAYRYLFLTTTAMRNHRITTIKEAVRDTA